MPNKLDFPKRKDIRTSNNIHVAIYVPSTKNIDEKIPEIQFKQRITETIRFLRTTLGGSTSVSGVGNYRSDQRGSVTENIAKVESFTTSAKYNIHDLRIRKWLLNKKREWGQESLSYEWEEKLFFV